MTSCITNSLEINILTYIIKKEIKCKANEKENSKILYIKKECTHKFRYKFKNMLIIHALPIDFNVKFNCTTIYYSYCRDHRDAADIILQYTTNVITNISDHKYISQNF